MENLIIIATGDKGPQDIWYDVEREYDICIVDYTEERALEDENLFDYYFDKRRP
ncbi:hypothetical protein [Candidatus Pelagisphaera phototrophica]|uniref:hypothetical protein n=1 Tax=Candidatus Pelagisphaera phototrophica TaxID=2684113 RepID=UPI0019EBBF03|nr:hypothetical protein [Candidatus Pelagisphaera phototrophica]QXD33018.1 hypothetical protein GA004_04710 [Candidatus Pelagisphaera phototrophica]